MFNSAMSPFAMFDFIHRHKRQSTIKDSGSASVEFVILAIPLFLPIFIYLTQFADLSNSEIESRSLVRQIVRAYVSAQSLDDARSRAEIVLNYGAGRLGFSPSEVSAMRLTFSCSADPCLTPGARVRGNLTLSSLSTHRVMRVSAQEYVSPWQ
jgi:Flp pilus assembly protein TadG